MDDGDDERGLLIQGEADAAASLDKTMITLSSGALVLSITFIHEIAPQPILVGLLFASWAFFLLSLISMVISLITSQYAFREAQKKLAASYEAESSEVTYASKTDMCTAVLTWISIVAFVLGVAFLAWFAVENIPSQSPVRKTEVVVAMKVTKGRRTPATGGRKATGGRRAPVGQGGQGSGQGGKQTSKPATSKPSGSK